MSKQRMRLIELGARQCPCLIDPADGGYGRREHHVLAKDCARQRGRVRLPRTPAAENRRPVSLNDLAHGLGIRRDFWHTHGYKGTANAPQTASHKLPSV